MKTSGLFIITTFFLLMSVHISAQDKKVITSKLNEVTVFFKGAELTHTASATLAKGENEVIVEGLSPVIDRNSLKINATNSVLISSYEYSIDYLSTGKAGSASLKILKDSIDLCNARLEKIDIDTRINNNVMKQLQEGITKNVSGSEKGLGIDDLIKSIDYLKSKSLEMEIAQSALTKEKAELEKTITRLRSQHDQESVKGNKSSGILKLNLSAPRPGSSTFTITYFTSDANWTPYYDITISSIDKPISIALKSKVMQTTGFDWSRVNMTLSTSTPSNGKVAPLFSSWFLYEKVKNLSSSLAGRVPGLAMQNSFSYDDSSELQEVVTVSEPRNKVFIRGVTSGSSAGPLVVIDGEVSSQDELEAIDPAMIKDMQVIKDQSLTSIYGTSAQNGAILITLKSGMDDYVTESDNALNMVYNIDLPYTIPGNGKVQSIDLQTKEIQAEYKYYCAPKLDTETYLLAEIADWQKLGLLTGKANVTYDGTYIGETLIDASSTHEKLTLTLGSDKRVAVRRSKMQDFSSTKSLGSDTQQIFTYQITVKNNQNKPIKMVLKDQYPISTQKNIDVTLRKETTPWTANKEDVGVITWEEEFAPGESKSYQLSYSVKYPKNMNLNL